MCYYTPMMIEAVFFDLYGTLAGFKPDTFEVQSQVCAEFGIEVTRRGIIAGYAMADAFMADQNAVRPLSRLSSDERADFFAEYERLVLKGCGADVSREKAGEIWQAIRQVPYGLALYDDVLPVMDMLKMQGLTLGLISNMSDSGEKTVADLRLTPYMDVVVTSDEVGAAKPHPPIFREALRRAGADAANAMHVGDQLRSDVRGAQNAGIQPVLLDRDGNHPGFAECPRIESLVELAGLLGAGMANR